MPQTELVSSRIGDSYTSRRISYTDRASPEFADAIRKAFQEMAEEFIREIKR